MASPDGPDESEALRNVERLTYFSDAVIAIAVTLLVLPRVDEASSDRASSLRALLDESGAELFVFVLSFVVICRFWLVHHDMFRTLRTFDGRLFWLNALWLLSIVAGAPSPRLAPSIANLSVFALVFLLALIVPGQALWGLLLLAPAGLLADRLHPATSPP